jgi:phosphoribosylamine--glycine ligase
MALLEGDLGELLASAAAGDLAPAVVEVAEGRHAVVVVLAAAGYPASVRKGDPIRGLEHAATVEGVQLLHAGTARREGELVTAGGRVLGVTAIGISTGEARQRAYAAIDRIRWEGMQRRMKAPGAQMTKKVLVVMGSDSDFDQLEPAWQILDELGIAHSVRVASAHRSPDVVRDLAVGARAAGFGVVIAAAGLAAHLAGVLAAHTTLPVVAVPIATGTLGGIDALLSSTQMPPGVPIATVGVGGARNGGLLAAAILGIGDESIAAALDDYRKAMKERVAAADARVRQKLGDTDA